MLLPESKIIRKVFFIVNKLQGFYELKRMGIPSVPWLQFTGNEHLNENLLWTVRMAVLEGNDIDLPRAVGVTAQEAILKGKELIKTFEEHDLIIYYPYFIALKSGTIEIRQNKTIIEAVQDDLWNLTTTGGRDITLIIDRETNVIQKSGDTKFLTDDEIKELLKYAGIARGFHREYIFDQTSVLLEWSYAINTDINKHQVGKNYLVFYECRTIGTGISRTNGAP